MDRRLVFSVQLIAQLALTRQTLNLLVDKEMISAVDAAGVFTRAAEAVRCATEDEPSPEVGEAIAKAMEAEAAGLLQLPPAL